MTVVVGGACTARGYTLLKWFCYGIWISRHPARFVKKLNLGHERNIMSSMGIDPKRCSPFCMSDLNTSACHSAGPALSPSGV